MPAQKVRPYIMRLRTGYVTRNLHQLCQLTQRQTFMQETSSKWLMYAQTPYHLMLKAHSLCEVLHTPFNEILGKTKGPE